MDNAQLAELARLVDLPEEQLFAELGAEFRSRSLGALPPGQDDKTLGQSFFTRFLDEARDGICGNRTLRSIAGGSESTVVADVLPQLFDIVLAYVAATPPAATLTALIMKIGLKRICAGHWQLAQSPGRKE